MHAYCTLSLSQTRTRSHSLIIVQTEIVWVRCLPRSRPYHYRWCWYLCLIVVVPMTVISHVMVMMALIPVASHSCNGFVPLHRHLEPVLMSDRVTILAMHLDPVTRNYSLNFQKSYFRCYSCFRIDFDLQMMLMVLLNFSD